MSVSRSQLASIAVLVLLTTMGAVRADTIASPTTEYQNRIKVGETIQPLGETPFGETVSLYTGNLGFRQTDISLPGIGPDIVLTRTYDVTGSPITKSFDLPMADWNLAVPEISTIVPGKQMGYVGAWNIGDQNTPAARCSKFGVVSQAPFGFGLPWWHGYQLITGDGNSQPLVKRTPENTLAPGGNTAAYPILTPGLWMLSCLAATSNGMPGEGFLATAPDGTRYWFDHLAYGEPLETLIEQVPRIGPGASPGSTENVTRGSPASTDAASGLGGSDTDVYWGIDILYMPRKTGHLYASRVEDRFGNWVTYRYSGNQLQEITASDGRHIEVKWRADAPLVDAITIQPGTPEARTWSYSYDAPTNPAVRRLVQVLQPDNSTWQLDTGWASAIKAYTPGQDNLCGTRTFTQLPSDDDIAWIFMVHPSGLEGLFRLSLRAHSRSWVPTQCAYYQGTLSPASEHLPPVYLSLSLTNKTFSGPGFSPRAWTYRYSPALGSTAQECSQAPCKDWQWVEVTGPDGQTTHYRFSNHWGYMEGKLLAKVDGVEQPGTDNPVGLRKETFEYADPGMIWPYPSRLGEALQDPISFSNNDAAERLSPERVKETLQQDVRFRREIQAFDQYANPVRIRRASSPGGGHTEQISYWGAGSQWILGLVATTTVDGRNVSQTDYDSRSLPLRTYAFDALQATYGYAANGMLSTITDPRGNTTTLSAHKRGIPQLIRFADATEVAPVVDDLGQVVSVRNQLGDVTAYRYDSMGRLERTTFPTGDTVAWNPVNRNFRRSDVAQFGLPAGHWIGEVRTGSAVVTTIYDASWRPRILVTEDGASPTSRSYVVKRYDGYGREIYSSYPVASVPAVDASLPGLKTSYDALGRVLTVVQDSELGPLTTRREYLSGYRTRVTNPRGFSTTTSFQTFDEPSEAAPVRIEAPQGVTTVIDRDVFGKPLSITRSGPVN